MQASALGAFALGHRCLPMTFLALRTTGSSPLRKRPRDAEPFGSLSVWSRVVQRGEVVDGLGENQELLRTELWL